MCSVYLDCQSAKPVDPVVVDAMFTYFTERFGNPAALHAVGDAAGAAPEDARAKVAALIGVESPDGVVFTSGATESNNLALIGPANRNRRSGDHFIIAEVEHISIQNLSKHLERQGFRASRVPPDQYGRVSLDKLRQRIIDETILVSVGWASSEIGAVQPIAEIAETLSGSEVALRVYAVAVEDQLPINMSADCALGPRTSLVSRA